MPDGNFFFLFRLEMQDVYLRPGPYAVSEALGMCSATP